LKTEVLAKPASLSNRFAKIRDGEYGESQTRPKSCGWDERREVLAPIE
jgi:hypothetical protein